MTQDSISKYCLLQRILLSVIACRIILQLYKAAVDPAFVVLSNQLSENRRVLLVVIICGHMSQCVFKSETPKDLSCTTYRRFFIGRRGS